MDALQKSLSIDIVFKANHGHFPFRRHVNRLAFPLHTDTVLAAHRI
jgi:hypothetical protein